VASLNDSETFAGLFVDAMANQLRRIARESTQVSASQVEQGERVREAALRLKRTERFTDKTARAERQAHEKRVFQELLDALRVPRGRRKPRVSHGWQGDSGRTTSPASPMSIAPPSDIVLDVARAADPTRYSEAASRLKQVAAAASTGAGFGAMLTAWQPEDLAPGGEDALGAVEDLAARAVAGKPPEAVLRKPDAFSAFEAMVLTNFVGALMPRDSAAVFGEGNAGQIWASMMAEQVAAKVAEAGGIGIAERLRRADAGRTPSAGAVDPAVPTNADAIVDTIAATSERGFLAGLGLGAPDGAAASKDEAV
jgi:flagellar protein FlgJ